MSIDLSTHRIARRVSIFHAINATAEFIESAAEAFDRPRASTEEERLALLGRRLDQIGETLYGDEPTDRLAEVLRMAGADIFSWLEELQGR